MRVIFWFKILYKPRRPPENSFFITTSKSPTDHYIQQTKYQSTPPNLHHSTSFKMKSSFFAIIAVATASLVSAAPSPAQNSALVTIPPSCVICDGIGIPCIAACIAGGPADPFCDFCAVPEIWQCITVSTAFLLKISPYSTNLFEFVTDKQSAVHRQRLEISFSSRIMVGFSIGKIYGLCNHALKAFGGKPFLVSSRRTSDPGGDRRKFNISNRGLSFKCASVICISNSLS
jgi:hypothetical protein